MTLYHSLGIAAESLFATSQGVDTAGHNIANAHKPGYSRQRVELEQRVPSETRGIIRGNGVFVKTISRAHDQFLEKELNAIKSSAGESDSRFQELNALQDIYSPELSSTVADEVTTFFNALQELSNFPEELAVRTYVREAAHNLAGAFHRVDDSLHQAQGNVNNRVLGETVEANEIMAQLAKINISLGNLETEGRQANDLRDQQDQLLGELVEKIDCHYYRGDNDMLVVRGPAETLLVDSGDAARMGAKLKGDGSQLFDVFVTDSTGSSMRNISSDIKSGKIKAYLDVRDDIIEGLIGKNNEMASTLANHVNEVHREGFGLKEFREKTGRNFFAISDNPEAAARSINVSDVINHSTDAIAAAITPAAPGDNVNINNILRLKDARLLENGNATLNDYYANYVGEFGLDVVRTEHVKEADDILLADLKGRRESIAGVSLDEEAMNILRWQSNFTASSRVITTVDEMMETVLGLKR